MADFASVLLNRIDGTPDTLGSHAGKVLLVVNVASKCGLTAQYQGLEELYRQYREQGFEVLGFPANDFGAQEPGSNAEIADFCAMNYGVSFPLFAKADVTGPKIQPLYAALTKAHPSRTGPEQAFRDVLAEHKMPQTQPPEVLWNFEKFLIARDGTIAARFAPNVEPRDHALVQAIETELAK